MHRFRDRNPSLTNMFVSHFCWWDLFPSRFIKTDSSLPWELRLKISWSSYTRRLRIPPWAVFSVRDAGLYCCAWWTDLTDVELWSSVVRDWVLSALSSLDCYNCTYTPREMRWEICSGPIFSDSACPALVLSSCRQIPRGTLGAIKNKRAEQSYHTVLRLGQAKSHVFLMCCKWEIQPRFLSLSQWLIKSLIITHKIWLNLTPSFADMRWLLPDIFSLQRFRWGALCVVVYSPLLTVLMTSP